MTNPDLILASSSPRRQELIPLLGLPWLVRVAHVDEESITDVDPAKNVIDTATLKAVEVSAKSTSNSLVIGADTTVALDGKMLNKPADEQGAKKMLISLRGRSHEVHTGITVIDTRSDRTIVDVCSVDVTMRDYSDAEIDDYIASGDPLDKAGSYAIQHPEFRPVEKVNGCYATVVGMPLCHLVRALRELGTTVTADVPAACQRHHSYDCPIYDQILNPA